MFAFQRRSSRSGSDKAPRGPALNPATLAGAAVALWACAPALTVPATRCDAQAHQALVGMNVGEIRLPGTLSQRIVSPGDPVAPAVDPARLNIFVDPKGWIGRVNCG